MNSDFFNGIPLSEVCARMVDDSGRPLKAIAAEIGKGYSTLYRELDPNDEGGKLGVDTLLPLIRACIPAPFKSAPTPVIWLNSKCGFKAVPLCAKPNHADVRDEAMDDLNALNEFQQALRDKRNKPAVIAVLARALQVEIDETVEQYCREWEKEKGVTAA